MRFNIDISFIVVEAARKVAGGEMSAIAGLVDRSLVSQIAQDRFDIHESLRFFAESNLSEESGQSVFLGFHLAG